MIPVVIVFGRQVEIQFNSPRWQIHYYLSLEDDM